ncbi:diversity-generating retroelement protein Avd [Calothrix sp. FACHB-156]|nr:diversity-generating retroelement protein Avd [Calothrix sp. FACHB-156]
MKELSVIQKTYDCIKWYVPILERLPKIHKFTLGDRIINQLYDLLEGLIKAKYAKDKLPQLESINTQLDILRYQTRMLLDFEKMSIERYEYAIKIIDEIGTELGGWIKKLRGREK